MSSDKYDNLNEKYIDTIENLPNHKEIDFLRLAISNPLSTTQSLKLPDGQIYQITRLGLASYIIRRLFTWVFLIFLTTPAWIVTYWNFQQFIK